MVNVKSKSKSCGRFALSCEKQNASDNKTKLLDLIKSLPEQNIIDIKF